MYVSFNNKNCAGKESIFASGGGGGGGGEREGGGRSAILSRECCLFHAKIFMTVARESDAWALPPPARTDPVRVEGLVYNQGWDQGFLPGGRFTLPRRHAQCVS